MWTQRVDGVLRLSFDEKRKKRKPRQEQVPDPKILIAIKEGETELYLNPSNSKTKKLSRSAGALATLSDVLQKMEYNPRSGLNSLCFFCQQTFEQIEQVPVFPVKTESLGFISLKVQQTKGVWGILWPMRSQLLL